MANFILTGPDGGTFRVEAPDEQSALRAFQQLQQQPVPDQGVEATSKADIGGRQVGIPQVPEPQENLPFGRQFVAGVNREFEAIDQAISPTTPFETNEDGSAKFPPVGEVVLTDIGNQIRLQDGRTVPITDDVAILTMDDGRRLAFPRTDENRISPFERFSRLFLLGAATGSPSRFAGRTAQNVTELARRNQAAEFGMDLSRGQASQINRLQEIEENARQGVLGPLAKEEATQFFGNLDTPGRQTTQVDQAVAGIADELGGGATVGLPKEAADSALEAVRAETQRLRTAADQAFDTVRGAKTDPLTFSQDFVQTVRMRAAQALDDADLALDPVQHPASAQAMSMLNDLSQVRRSSGAIPFDMLDKVRRRLVNIKATPGSQDGTLLRTLRRSYTDFLDDAATSALLSGDPSIAQTNKDAISFWRQYKQITDSAVGNESDAVIRKMVSPAFDATTDQVVNWLFGATKVGMTPQAVKTTRRLKKILGADSQAIQDLRQGAFLKAASVNLGQGRKGPQAMSNSLNDFLNSDLAKELYSKPEIDKMRRFVGVLRNTIPPKDVTNPSRTAFKGIQTLRAALSAVATAIGMDVGGAAGALLGGAGFLPVTDRVNRLRIRNLIEPQKLSSLITSTRGGPLQKIAAPASVILPTTLETQGQLPDSP